MTIYFFILFQYWTLILVRLNVVLLLKHQ